MKSDRGFHRPVSTRHQLRGEFQMPIDVGYFRVRRFIHSFIFLGLEIINFRMRASFGFAGGILSIQC